jgi:hypothetical protein
MPAFLIPLIGLVTSVCNLIGTEESMKYISQLNDAQMSLQTELAKGYDSDDAKIEALYAQIHVLVSTVQQQLAVFQAKPVPAPVATTT